MRKKLTATLILVLTLVLTGPASAQFFMSHLSDATCVDIGELNINGGVSFFEDLFGMGGNVRYGVSDAFEFGVRMGFVKIDAGQGGGDDHTGLSFGGNVKYQFLDFDYGDPLDMAFGGGIEYYDVGEDASLTMFGGNLLFSYPLEIRNGPVFSPLFRLNMRFDRRAAGDYSDTDFQAAFGFGAHIGIGENVDIYGELVIDDGDGAGTGLVAGILVGI